MSSAPQSQASGPTTTRIDVTDLPADEVSAFARTRRAVHLERRGGRTYLVAD